MICGKSSIKNKAVACGGCFCCVAFIFNYLLERLVVELALRDELEVDELRDELVPLELLERLDELLLDVVAELREERLDELLVVALVLGFELLLDEVVAELPLEELLLVPTFELCELELDEAFELPFLLLLRLLEPLLLLPVLPLLGFTTLIFDEDEEFEVFTPLLLIGVE